MKLKLMSSILVGALLLSGCQLLNNEPDKEQVHTGEVITTEEAEAEGNETVETQETTVEVEKTTEPSLAEVDDNRPEDGIQVNTGKGMIYYSDQWVDYMEVETTEERDSSVVNFQANFDGEIIPLFTLVIGNGEGTKVGELTDVSGNSNDVMVTMHELPELELTETEQNRLYAMQEDINYVIDHIK